MEVERTVIIGGEDLDNDLTGWGDTLNTLRRMAERMKKGNSYHLEISANVKASALLMKEKGVSEWYFISVEFPTKHVLSTLKVKGWMRFFSGDHTIEAKDLTVR